MPNIREIYLKNKKDIYDIGWISTDSMSAKQKKLMNTTWKVFLYDIVNKLDIGTTIQFIAPSEVYKLSMLCIYKDKLYGIQKKWIDIGSLFDKNFIQAKEENGL